MRRPRRPGTLLFALLLGACYTYAPIEPGAVEPRMSVRARISASAGQRIAPLLGMPEARELIGTVIAVAPDTLVVEVPTVARAEPGSAQALTQRVSVHRSDVVELESRKLDRVRTSVLVGGTTVVVGGALIRALQGEPGQEKLPGGGGTDAWIPLWRLVR